MAEWKRDGMDWTFETDGHRATASRYHGTVPGISRKDWTWYVFEGFGFFAKKRASGTESRIRDAKRIAEAVIRARVGE